MINDARFANLSFRDKRDFLAEINVVDNIWDTKKARWAKAAESAPTLKQFLEDKFYGKN
jgi:hypothetical protein